MRRSDTYSVSALDHVVMIPGALERMTPTSLPWSVEPRLLLEERRHEGCQGHAHSSAALLLWLLFSLWHDGPEVGCSSARRAQGCTNGAGISVGVLCRRQAPTPAHSWDAQPRLGVGRPCHDGHASPCSRAPPLQAKHEVSTQLCACVSVCVCANARACKGALARTAARTGMHASAGVCLCAHGLGFLSAPALAEAD